MFKARQCDITLCFDFYREYLNTDNRQSKIYEMTHDNIKSAIVKLHFHTSKFMAHNAVLGSSSHSNTKHKFKKVDN